MLKRGILRVPGSVFSAGDIDDVMRDKCNYWCWRCSLFVFFYTYFLLLYAPCVQFHNNLIKVNCKQIDGIEEQSASDKLVWSFLYLRHQ